MTLAFSAIRSSLRLSTSVIPLSFSITCSILNLNLSKFYNYRTCLSTNIFNIIKYVRFL